MSPAGRWGITVAGVVLSLSLAAWLRTALRRSGPPDGTICELPHVPRVAGLPDEKPQAPTTPAVDKEPSEAPVTTPAEPGNVEVMTTLGWNGQPVGGVAVGIMLETKPRVVFPEQLRTDANGLAFFPNVPSGRLTICARGKGYLESCRTAELQAGGILYMGLGLVEDEAARATVATP